MTDSILIIGSSGQIGTELTLKLRADNKIVIASDIKEGSKELMQSGVFEFLDATDKEAILLLINKYQITSVYLMAAMLSVTAEKFPAQAWDLNMTSLFHILNLAKDGIIKKVFWPSSIAVFGNTTPRIKTPQETITEPNTVYGISKLSGERWCNYYHDKYNVDVRTIRYPGIISWKTKPGGGTTDYAVDIFHKAIEDNSYTCFLKNDTKLPMLYMDDAIKATIDIMETTNIAKYIPYNIGGISFTPNELASEIKKHQPNFTIDYKPDFRQEIADSWPNSIDDTTARMDWHWKHKFNISDLTIEMLKNLKTN
ncbi:MAG: NAD-dependent epimerase/dehydratase family protein [Flavobacteriaceae bacterium]